MATDDELYRGRIDHIADRKLTSVRIFISSTFTGKSAFLKPNLSSMM